MLEHFAELTSEGIVIHVKSQIIDANSQAAEMFGYSRDEFIGLNVLELVAPESQSLVKSNMEKGYGGQYSHLALKKGGAIFPVEVRSKPARYHGESTARAVCIRDITEQWQNEMIASRSEKQLKLALSAGKIATMEWNISTDAVAWSSNINEIIQRPENEIPGDIESYINIIHADDQSTVRAILDNIMTGIQAECRYSHRIEVTDGDVRWLDIRGEINPGYAGKPSQMIAAVSDTTERIKLENTLRENENRYRIIFERANDGILIFHDRMIINCNQRALDILRRRKAQVVGQNLSAISPDSQPDGVNSKEKAVSIINRALAGNPMVEEWVNTSADGVSIDVELSLNKAVIGNATVLLCLMRDITERKRAEREIEYQRSYLRQIIDTNPNMIYARDRQGFSTMANKTFASFYGLEPDDIVGTHIAEIVRDEEQLATFLESDASVIDEQKELVIDDLKLNHPSTGETRWFQKVIRPLSGKGGRFDQALCVMVDITERRRAEEAYRVLVESSLQGITVFQGGRIVFANEAMEQIIGYSVEELMAAENPITSFAYPEDHDTIAERFKAFRRGGQASPFVEYRIIRKDGEVCWAEAYTILTEYKGQPAHQTVTLDVTERKKAEKALVDSEARQRAILAALPDILFVFDSDGNLVDYHIPETTRAVDLANLDGKQIGDIFDPDISNVYCEAIVNTLKTKEVQKIAYKQKTETGTRYYEGLMSVSSQNQFIVITRDVTVGEENKLALEEQRNFLRQVIDTNPNFIYARDRNGYYTLANQAFINTHGLQRPDDIIGRKLNDFVLDTQQSWKKTYQQDIKVIDNQEEFNIPELEIKLPTGETRWLQIVKKPIFNTDGTSDQLLGVVVDITRRKNTENELLQRNKEMEMLYQVGKQINSSLEIVDIFDTLHSFISRNVSCDCLLLGNYLATASQVGYEYFVHTGAVKDVRGLANIIVDPINGTDPLSTVIKTGNSIIHRRNEDPMEIDGTLPSYVNDIEMIGKEPCSVEFCQSALFIPLIMQERVVGIIQIYSRDENAYSPEQLLLIEALASQFVVATNNAMLYKKAQADYEIKKQAQYALENQRSQLRQVIDTVPNQIFVRDRRGYYMLGNKALADSLGVEDTERIIGKKPESFDVIPEYTDDYREQDLEVIESGQEIQLDVKKVKDLNGDLRWFQTIKRPLFFEKGTEQVLGVIIDLTDQKTAEEELLERNKDLLVINKIISVITSETSLENTMSRSLNTITTTLNYEVGIIYILEPGSEHLAEIASSGNTKGMKRKCRELCKRVLSDGKVINSVDDKSESLNNIYVCTPIKSREITLGVLCMVKSTIYRSTIEHDIRLLDSICSHLGVSIENARLNEETAEMEILREVDRLREELITNVAHELRTPLGLITIIVTTLLSSDVSHSKEEGRELLTDALDEAEKLEEIASGLLDTSSWLENGRMQLNKEYHDLVGLITSLVKTMSPKLENRQVAIDLQPEEIMIFADKSRLERAIINILTNAIKYTRGKGEITVYGRVDRNEETVYLKFIDNGIGIPKKDLPRIFDRLYRVKSEQTQNIGGAGIGLSICKGLIEAHGGQIWATSVLGEGSTFHIKLPQE